MDRATEKLLAPKDGADREMVGAVTPGDDVEDAAADIIEAVSNKDPINLAMALRRAFIAIDESEEKTSRASSPEIDAEEG